ncbi:low molecular weight phosphotyrosine protein phosphatase [Akkermansiaceae bacterium]|nr:low molecular weight phosphotyrosine protein phosphatase [Akkermansiaceae bacterium]MDB4607971.1 low molecular weight phosphotyrosine protein phosphatase [bacterium]MDB4543469.1 low molecular weight phosphotyrosine protein phosphatase [Akkermansiaceae bacterium]MDB4750854.1 low molecular weight phosphotyrosine protein phosphatase [Akkermansiaceae bacterium]MDB4757263.1 low molecular weight phosphotyrosine protein phosphatase [Akkermansiaceae bacterium]
MESRYNILFVCMGNICRSPAGENIFRQVVEDAGLSDHIHCDSAGTIGIHSGNNPDTRMSKTLRRRGYKVTGCARQFSLQDFEIFDLILVMDDENHRNILKLADTEEKRAKLRRFTSFCLQHHHHEVPDPYYGGDAGFQLVADLIEDGSKGLIEHLKKELDLT